MSNTKLLIIQAMSPVHAGTGQAIGGIDLPIAREKPTNLPLIPGSTIKGVLRSRSSQTDDMHTTVFGPDTENASDYAGSVQFGDALLAFLPVRSMRGTFAWVTSPFMLRRLYRDAKEAGIDLPAIPDTPAESQAMVTKETKLVAEKRVVFEDFDFQAKTIGGLGTVANKFAQILYGSEDNAKQERNLFASRVCVVHDDVMAVLLQTCTEFTTRIRMDPDKKTVAKGALWTEESLPAESILASLVAATPVKRSKDSNAPSEKELFAHVKNLLGKGIQFGGNATIGRGLCHVRMEG